MAGLMQLLSRRGQRLNAPNAPAIQVKSVPPPVGGWNRRDAVPLMDAKDALALDNWIPDTNAVRLRPGYAVHATIAATSTAVETLIQYAPPNGSTEKLFAAIPTAVYDVTAAATASSTAVAVSSLTNGRWQYDYMSNTSGNYLMMANGADSPRLFDGSTWTTASVTATGLTISNIISVHNHMNRLWLIEENQLHAWYLGTSAIAGAPTKFLPPFRKGGKLMAMGSWTRDGGSGPDDFAVFVSSKGECVIYAGVDPSSASTSALVGIYDIPDVIGRRCIINAGAELGILTMQGLVPLSQILGMSAGAAARTSFTNKIINQFREQFEATGTSFGWQCIEYARRNLLFINVPITERSDQEQYVMNIITGAWCRFTGMDAGCWGMLGNNLYFGGNNATVYKFDDVALDVSSNIIGTVQHAYSTFGSPKTKRFTKAKPLFLAPPGYLPPVSIQTDYDVAAPSVTILAAAAGGTQWDAGQWDTFQWAGGTQPSSGWQGLAGEGRAGSIAFGVSSPEELVYNGVDVAYETGDYL
jgi:hypothetical protein